jgi:hypothetical protein
MNQRIYEDFQRLPDAAQARLRAACADSPKLLALVDFLRLKATAKFRTEQAVQAVYSPELKAGESYAVLENRFYKLRKKLLERIDEERHLPTVPESPEELELMACRVGMMEGRYLEMQERLLALEERLWKRNLFELLPNVLLSLALCMQRIGRYADALPVLERAHRARLLQSDLLEALGCVRHSQSERMLSGQLGDIAAEGIARLAVLARKHPEYPRFRLLYQAEVLVVKCSAVPALPHAQYQRLSAQWKALRTEYPAVPFTSIEPGQEAHGNFRITAAESSYHFAHGRMAEAARAQEAAWAAAAEAGILAAIPEGAYVNRVILLLGLQQWPEAFSAAQQLAELQQRNGRFPGQAYQLQAMCLVGGYPSFEAGPLAKPLLERLKDWRRHAEAEHDVLSAELAVTTQASLLLVLGKWTDAWKLYQDPRCHSHYENRGFAFQGTFYEAFAQLGSLSLSARRERLASLLATVDAYLAESPNPQIAQVLHWMHRYIQHHLKH